MSNNMLPPPSGNGHGVPALSQGRSAAAPFASGAVGVAPAGGGGGDLGLKRYISALNRHKWIILLVTVIGTAIGFAATRFIKPTYSVSSQVWINPTLAGPSAPIRSGQLLSESGWPDLLRSQAVIDSVIRSERLYVLPANPGDSLLFANFELPARFAPGQYTLDRAEDGRGLVLKNESGSVVSQARPGEPIGSEMGFAWTPPVDAAIRARPVEFEVRAPVDVAGELSQNLSSPVPEEGPFMFVRLRGTDPERITRTLTALLHRFEDIATQLKTAQLEVQTKTLEEQAALASIRLENAESELRDFEVTTVTLPKDDRVLAVVPGLQMTDNSAIQGFFSLSARRDQIRDDREAILEALENPSADVITTLELIPAVQQNSLLSQALSQAGQEQANLRALETTFTDEYRGVRIAKATLDSLKQRTIPLLARDLVKALDEQYRDLDAQIGEAGSELRSIPARRIRETQLQRRVALADQLYKDLEGRLYASKLAEMTAVPDISILSWPSVPYTPILDERSRMLLMFFGGSLGLALVGAILRDRFDSRVRYPDEITGRMGLNILGAVPALRRGKIGSTDMALAVEAFRAIQLSLVHSHGAEAPLMVTFTSPGASDGKSFVTSNLAIAFADMGHRTIVIDGDVRRGSQHQLMGSSHKPGLTDHLAGKASRAEVVQHTRYPMLDLIPCGSRGETGPKLLGSPAMGHLIEALRADYDVILVDSPPLGACVDPMILGTLTRNLVLVLRTGSTDRAMAESKLDILDRLPVRVLGAVLNDVSSSGPYRYYSYISGYEVIEEIDEGREVRKIEEPSAGTVG